MLHFSRYRHFAAGQRMQSLLSSKRELCVRNPEYHFFRSVLMPTLALQLLSLQPVLFTQLITLHEAVLQNRTVTASEFFHIFFSARQTRLPTINDSTTRLILVFITPFCKQDWFVLKTKYIFAQALRPIYNNYWNALTVAASTPPTFSENPMYLAQNAPLCKIIQ